jgi:hypothetical protein
MCVKPRENVFKRIMILNHLESANAAGTTLTEHDHQALFELLSRKNGSLSPQDQVMLETTTKEQLHWVVNHAVATQKLAAIEEVVRQFWAADANERSVETKRSRSDYCQLLGKIEAHFREW